MTRSRSAVLISILRGLAAAIGATLALMIILGAAVAFLGVSDGTIRACNQLIKLAAVVLGARVAVGIGGEKGFHLGFVVGILYMFLGYYLYLRLGGGKFGAVPMMGEILLGAATGAASGAIFANLRPRRREKAHG